MRTSVDLEREPYKYLSSVVEDRLFANDPLERNAVINGALLAVKRMRIRLDGARTSEEIAEVIMQRMKNA